MELVAKRAPKFQPNQEVEITIAPNAGACFGVVRAIKLGRKALAEANGKAVHSLGPLIHNPTVVKELQDSGLIPADSEAAIQEGVVVLRSHGIRKEIEEKLKADGVSVIDATCPLVKKPQRIAQSLGEKDYFLVVVGDKNHPEVRGVVSYYGKSSYLVTYCVSDISQIPKEVQKVGVLAQTTIEAKVFQDVVDRCKADFQEVVVYNTICDATSVRQREVKELAQEADLMIVVGGKNSSNTRKLEKICLGFGKPTYLIENASDISVEWFRGVRKIGVTGGASTPMDFVDEIGTYVASLVSNLV